MKSRARARRQAKRLRDTLLGKLLAAESAGDLATVAELREQIAMADRQARGAA